MVDVLVRVQLHVCVAQRATTDTCRHTRTVNTCFIVFELFGDVLGSWCAAHVCRLASLPLVTHVLRAW